MANPRETALQQQIAALIAQVTALQGVQDEMTALRAQLDAANADNAALLARIADLQAKLDALTPVPDPTPDPVPDPVPDPKPDPTPDPSPDTTPDPTKNPLVATVTFGGWAWGLGDQRAGGIDRKGTVGKPGGTMYVSGVDWTVGYWIDEPNNLLYSASADYKTWKKWTTEAWDKWAVVAADPRPAGSAALPVGPVVTPTPTPVLPSTPPTPSPSGLAKTVTVAGLNNWTFSVEHANSKQRREGYDRLVILNVWGSNGYGDWLWSDNIDVYLHSGDLNIWQKFFPDPDWHWETCPDPRGDDAPPVPKVPDGVNRDLSTLKNNFVRLLHKPCYPGNTDAASRRDDSGFNYFREAKIIPFFGGAHGGGQETNILALGLDPNKPSWLTWFQMMPATPVQDITIANFDRVHGYFKTTLQPGARHSYPGVFGKGRKIYCTQARAMPDSYNDFTPSPPAPRIWGGEYWNYDLDTGEFTYSDKWADRAGENTEPLRPGQQSQPHYFAFAACYDDVTGNILEADTALRMYVPETDDYIFGPSTGIGSINGHCVDRCPENDKFYLFSISDTGGTPGPIRVFETTPDRSNFANWKTKPITYAGAQPQGLYSKRERMRWDTKNRVFVGYFDQGKARVYDCLGVYGAPHTMYEVAMQLEAPIDNDPPSLSFHCHDYIPEHDIHIFVDVPAYNHGDPRTWGFRLDMKTAIPAPPPVIPDGMTLQTVLDKGGTVNLGTGTLVAGGQILKAGTNLVGNSTTLRGGSEVLGRGILVVSAEASVSGIEFQDASVSSGNGAAIRQDAGIGPLSIKKCGFVRCEDGFLGNSDVSFEDCYFVDCGKGDGQTHAVYVSGDPNMVVANSPKLATANNCTFRGTKIGHHFKSRAAKSVVTNCTMEAASESYSCDFSWGGVAEVTGCTMTQGPDTDNAVMVNFASEGQPFADNNLTMTDCTLTSSGVPNAIGVRIASALLNCPVTLTRVHFVGIPTPVQGGKVTYIDCTKDGVAFNG